VNVLEKHIPYTLMVPVWVCCDMQGEQILKDGIGSAPEIEEPLDPTLARKFLQQPCGLLQLDSTLMQSVAK
jgi:hypothetical protein